MGSDGSTKIPTADTQPVHVGDVLGVARIVRGAAPADPPNKKPELERTPIQTLARIADYQLVGRFPSSSATMVFLANKQSPFGVIRRAVVKWAGRQLDNFDSSRNVVLDEARAIAYLDHPNLVTILDVGEDAAGIYVAVEYVPGPDLRRIVQELRKRGENLPEPLACYVMIEVLHGLDHAHRAVGPDEAPLRIVHRDVNPSNIVISNTGHVKLTDFGMVHMRGRAQATTAPHIVKGKYRYMAPEYIAEQLVTPQADVYSVGLVLLELLTGELFFTGDEPVKAMTKIVQEGVPYGVMKTHGLHSDLQAIIRQATHRDPRKRFVSAKACAEAIEGSLRTRGIYVSSSDMASFLLEANIPSA
jgi:serine/threonine-protein kinase